MARRPNGLRADNHGPSCLPPPPLFSLTHFMGHSLHARVTVQNWNNHYPCVAHNSHKSISILVSSHLLRYGLLRRFTHDSLCHSIALGGWLNLVCDLSICSRFVWRLSSFELCALTSRLQPLTCPSMALCSRLTCDLCCQLWVWPFLFFSLMLPNLLSLKLYSDFFCGWSPQNLLSLFSCCSRGFSFLIKKRTGLRAGSFICGPITGDSGLTYRSPFINRLTHLALDCGVLVRTGSFDNANIIF